MSSILKTNAIEPEGATTELVVGKSGQTVTVGGSGGLKTNTFKDAGGGYKYAAFTSTGAQTWTCPTGVTSAEILIVAGGGGGSNEYYAGGGGAGGVVHAASYPVTAGTVYDLTVGAGGAVGTAGSNSVFNVNGEGSNTTVLTANGGGYGGGSGAPGNAGGAGGSGGGNDNDASSPSGGASNQPASFGSPSIATGYGNVGAGNNGDPGGGGGGAASAGSVASGNEGGAGGDGKYFANFDSYGTDSNNSTAPSSGKGYFAGGGGGGSWTGSTSVVGGAAGVGGGGKGGGYGPSSGRASETGLANTGGGGGGAGGSHSSGDGTGKVGGSGIIVIRYQDPTANTLFTSNGSGTLSSVSGFGGAQVLISSQTASNSASISFTSGLTSTYKEYVFEFFNINPATDSESFQFQVNASGQTGYNETITSTYFAANHNEAGTDANLAYTTARDQAQGTGYQWLTSTQGSGADECSAGELHLFNPSSTTYVKHFYSRMNHYHASDYSADSFCAGYINITAAIDEISFKMTSGNFDGTIKMYGIK